MTHTFWMVHGTGEEFGHHVVAIFPTEGDAIGFKDGETAWAISQVEIEVPFTLITETLFTPSN